MERSCRKMAENNKLRILNIISGAEFGGAELFFERIATSFEKNKNINQKVIIRSNENRFNSLKNSIQNIEQIKFFNRYNPLCKIKIKRVIEEFLPNIVMTWMNRASQIIPSEKISNEVTIGRLGGFYKIKNYSKCDYLITNTPDLKDYVISEGWDIRKVQFIPNFVSENKNGKINLKNSYNDTIICMGRFHENKAIDIMIKSMSFLPGFNLLIIGEGKLKETYNLLINKYHLGERVEIIGWRNNISEYLNACSILVCPSRHEPFGNIIVDGWAHKIPVIVSDVDGPKKIVKHKINGIKFEKDNVFDLVKKIKELSTSPNLRKKIIKNGFELYKKNYSEDVIVDKYIEYFKKISKPCAE